MSKHKAILTFIITKNALDQSFYLNFISCLQLSAVWFFMSQSNCRETWSFSTLENSFESLAVEFLTKARICGATTPPTRAQNAQLPIPMFLKKSRESVQIKMYTQFQKSHYQYTTTEWNLKWLSEVYCLQGVPLFYFRSFHPCCEGQI